MNTDMHMPARGMLSGSSLCKRQMGFCKLLDIGAEAGDFVREGICPGMQMTGRCRVGFL